MKICIPTMDDRGMDGMPSDHFGSAPYFTFFDTSTEETQVERNGGAHHVHGACRPLDFLGRHPVDAIVCRGLGKRAFSRLRDAGIEVFVTLEPDVKTTIEAMSQGRLRKLTSEEACHGHGHSGAGHAHAHGGTGHGHGPGAGLGRGGVRGTGLGGGRGP